MIIDGEKWHYLAVKKLSPFLRQSHRYYMVTTTVSILSICFEQKANVSHIKIFCEIMVVFK